MQLEKENKIWLESFMSKHKRKPRILHISNVANNAYNNAKILTECGLENHVIAYNDFYAMGCPEWEDADFIDEIKDMWRPDWSSYNLNNFCRPRWFAQGDLTTTVNYLIALSESRDDDTHALFLTLAQQNKSMCSDVENQLSHKNVTEKIVAVSATEKLVHVSRAKRIACAIRNYFWYSISRYNKHVASNVETGSAYGKWQIDDVLSSEFKKEFPDRFDQLSNQDFYAYYNSRPHMYRLLSHYDIVIAYAVEGIYPLMFGKPYFAFEHGTIRDIPYAQDTQARMCALTYRKATHVFVTNIDCVSSAKYLSPGKFTFINHPFDEDQSLTINDDWQQQRKSLLEKLNADMILFHPTRHDWVEGTGYADKANDIFLKAFISLRQKGFRLGLVCCEWGKNIAESKKLLQDDGVSDYVRWVKPLGVIAYTKMCKIANIVVDQFKLGAFGGVTFKALAAGSPVMSYIKVEQTSSYYSEVPPIINCRTENEITAQLSYWYTRQKELAEFGKNGRIWMKKFHNKSDTVNAQIRQFRLHL